MATQKKYWKSLEDQNGSPEVEALKQNEFAQPLPVEEFLGDAENLSATQTSRRDFLKFLGFSTAAATVAACEAPVVKSIPYVVKPEEVTPGVANYYASSYFDGNDFADVLVKTREGRPIKIEGNPESKNSLGVVNARVQGSILSLYDSSRLRSPMIKGQAAGWKNVDAEVRSKLAEIASSGKQITILSSTIISPSTKALIEEFKASYPEGIVNHVQMDAVSYHGALEANDESFGQRVLPRYHFNKAQVMVSIGADFLNNWFDGSAAAQFAETRKPENGKMSHLVSFESNLSLTGSNADKRFMIRPSDQGAIIVNLYNALAQKAGKSRIVSRKTEFDQAIEETAKKLWAAKGKSIVVASANNKDIQLVVNGINNLLGNYNSTIDLSQAVYLRQGSDSDMTRLVSDMNAGKVGALMVHGVNPVYTLASSKAFADGMKKVDLTLSTAGRMDETSELCKYACPANHNLESWDDAMPMHGSYSMQQPTIRPLFDTRQFQDSLLTWMGRDMSYYAYMKSRWTTLSGAKWNKVVHDGVFQNGARLEVSEFNVNLDSSGAKAVQHGKNGGQYELAFYQKTGMGIGQHSNNPWLQEMPDPITRNSWDNYLTVSPFDAEALGIKNKNVDNGALDGSYVTLKVGSLKLENVPAFIQPGQAKGTFGLAYGYGRTQAGKAGDGVGVNAFALVQNFQAEAMDVKIEVSSELHQFAATQLHHTMMGRAIVKEASLADFIKDPAAGNPDVLIPTHDGPKPPNEVTLWEEHDKGLHFWNLSIDLTSCIGCGACVVSCQVENNVPVVGKEEVRKSRDMHWLRIDRYYSSEEEKKQEAGEDFSYRAMEVPSEAPEVVFMPVMCQHCNHAPCETVCPVAATTHSSEGLNHMAYNRCIGTRYCANNCPYKVRRFNWFQYAENDSFDFIQMNDDLGKMVLNPDVTVRSRGVMEKCSMCIQRIQLGKLEAKKDGRKVEDGEIQTACASVCPTHAIKFGDAHDEKSEVAQWKESPRTYYLLEELNTQPSVFYQTKIRNKA